MNDLGNKSALITGGTKGIGYGIAEALLKEGINVAITGRTKKTAEEAAKRLNSNGNDRAQAIGLEADVRNYESQQKAVKETLIQFGGIDIVIANAGLGHFGSVEDISIEQWEETIDTNLSGPFYSLKASVEQLKKNKGYFITISSLAGTNFFKGGSAYNASKFGLTGFTQAVMLDLRDQGVKVSTIMPGSVSTHFNGNEPDADDAWKIQIEDVGKLIVDLIKMNSRTLPSKIEVRPSMPPSK
ncbi:MAG TPA: SDR family oxidoreductase [Aequorivita sp.]|jgi:NAD(P)-dependent dehydrogenase (short-subunit alcohol dehydrogenase family)|nr:short-chain dehydrogenase [Aequorivita sp.]MBP41100.1 short-chain dehydrogenase [Aequorivita sp.]HBC04188.1 short-chain dehydrogenase [Aequorivita sp.]HNP66809.1 SDR family oxidoreductase [Aequorivita sp.]|tara:strand:- start:29287 stop:30012 length:726 start_codon:yes stop_codon:yes gene_type:complete